MKKKRLLPIIILVPEQYGMNTIKEFAESLNSYDELEGYPYIMTINDKDTWDVVSPRFSDFIRYRSIRKKMLKKIKEFDP